MKIRFVAIGLILLSASGFAAADGDEQSPVEPAHPTHKTPANAAEAATDPSAILTQLGFFYWTDISDGGGSEGQTALFQPVLPLTKTNVLRPALPFLATPSPDRVTGMGDLFLLDAFFFQIPKATIGFGPVASLPTATDDSLGTGKYSLGFDFMFLYKGFKKNLWGFMFYPQWSVAGDSDRSDVGTLTFQLIWVKHTKWGYFGWTDQTGSVNFEEDNRLSFPIGLRFGKVFAAKGGNTLINLAVQPYYTYVQDSALTEANDVYGIKFSATFIKPKWLKH
jgi:hypothetical protein